MFFISYIINLLLLIQSIIAKNILFTIGWSQMSEETLNRISKHDRAVLVFSHTSYCDFYIMLLYMMAYPHQLNCVKTLVKPQPFAYAGFILRRLGAIPSTKITDKNGGAVDRIVNELSQSNRFLFMISPKGTIIHGQWRSGYYIIANKLKTNLMVTGLDYEKKSVYISESITSEEPENVVKEFLCKQMGLIVPLFPEYEVVSIREHDSHRRGVVDVYRLLYIATFILAIMVII